jgi:hypothetical protein
MTEINQRGNQNLYIRQHNDQKIQKGKSESVYQTTQSQLRWKQDTTTQETRIRSDLMKLHELSYTWLDMFDRNTSNCFITDSNDQLTAAMCFPFGSCLQVEDMISEKNKKTCQINMSKANLNNSIIGIFMKTYCTQNKCIWYLSKQSCDALNQLQRHCLDAYRVFYGKSSNYWSL